MNCYNIILFECKERWDFESAGKQTEAEKVAQAQKDKCHMWYPICGS